MEISSLESKYEKEIKGQLRKDLDCKNVMQVPSLQKIVVNMGLGEAIRDPKLIDMGVYTLTQITGQKPVVTRAKQAISNFKLREGVPIGVAVTLRGKKMFEFLEKLIHFSLPRMRDFRGLSGKAFDGHGNYTFGVKEQLVFPEVEYDRISVTKGMNITIVTSAKNDVEGRELLKSVGMPFRN